MGYNRYNIYRNFWGQRRYVREAEAEAQYYNYGYNRWNMVILDTVTTDITTTTLTTATTTTTLITVTTLSMDITVTRKIFRMENSRTQMQSLPKNFSHQKKI